MFFPFRFRRNKQINKAQERQVNHGKGAHPSQDYEHAAELSPTLSIPSEELKLAESARFRVKKQKIKHVNSFKLEQNNEFILGTAAGMIGAAVKYGFNELMQVLNIAKYDNNATSITVVMNSYEYTPVFWVFGFINALIIGAFFGMVIAFMMSYVFDERYYLLKGAGIGVGIWLFNFGFASKVFNYPAEIKYSLGDVVSMLLSLIIFAVVTVYSLKRLGFFKRSL